MRPVVSISGIAFSIAAVTSGGAEPPNHGFTLNPFQRAGLWLAVIITPPPLALRDACLELVAVGHEAWETSATDAVGAATRTAERVRKAVDAALANGRKLTDGGKGIDAVKYTSAKAGIRVDLLKGTAASFQRDAAGIGSDKLKGIENIISGDFADILLGSKEANVISGGAGADTIDGGLGNDTLSGGVDADVFVFSTKPDAKNIDTITDLSFNILPD